MIEPKWLIEAASRRQKWIDQAQSLNLFIPADVDKWDLMMLHFRAWELGIKSLYYLLPNFSAFNLNVQAIYGLPLSGNGLGFTFLYFLMYTGIVLYLATWVFSRRDMT